MTKAVCCNSTRWAICCTQLLPSKYEDSFVVVFVTRASIEAKYLQLALGMTLIVYFTSAKHTLMCHIMVIFWQKWRILLLAITFFDWIYRFNRKAICRLCFMKPISDLLIFDFLLHKDMELYNRFSIILISKILLTSIITLSP